MGFTIEDALVDTSEQYKLTLLAGKNGCANVISWVHMIEDTTIIQQLWGKELAVTTGLGFQSHDALFHFIECLVKYHSVGLIINTGKYIFDIPQDIIDYCNDQDFPLLVSPWEVHMADLIKDFSMRCLSSEKEDRQISKSFIKAFLNPKLIEEIRDDLTDAFDVDGYFQVLFVSISGVNELDTIGRRRLTFQLELYFEKIECYYSSFWFDGYFVLVVNNLSEKRLHEVVSKMYERAKKRISDRYIYIGIGTRVKDFRNIIKSYKRSLSAVNMAVQFEQPIVDFNDMGIYQVLFSIDDKEILQNMYEQLLTPLIEYDNKHHGELEMTLYYYLKCDGSPQLMSKQLYMHRNTINYRLIKIKELLNNDLSTYEEKFPFMLAFYIKNILKDVKN
ncbi:MAG: PucR family transcriptional regulator ligand-binding domain-containing protein [Coprobacillus sp.]